MRYRCILADPPWRERGGGKIKRGADRHYELMSSADISMAIGRQLFGPYFGDLWSNPCDWKIEPDCHLWLWVTNNFLPEGLKVMIDLGFTYKTDAVWVKDRIGLGQYFRHKHELLLLGTRGKYQNLGGGRSMPSVIEAPRRRHSQKPDEAYELIEAVSPGPRLELFATWQKPGWDIWAPKNHVNHRKDRTHG